MNYERPLTLAAMSMAIAVLMTGCGESKITQCNKLTGGINKLAPLAVEFDQKGQEIGKGFEQAKNLDQIKKQAGESAKTFNDFATRWDSSTQEIKTIELADEKLKGFQGRYNQAASTLGKGIRDMTKVLTDISKIEGTSKTLEKLKQIQPEINTISKNSQQAGTDMDKVAGEINSYCGGK